jgi:hypothetical protein
MTTPPPDNTDDGWAESTEGDLDPDLAVGGEYEEWVPSEAPSRMPLILRVGAALLLIAFLGPLVISMIR